MSLFFSHVVIGSMWPRWRLFSHSCFQKWLVCFMHLSLYPRRSLLSRPQLWRNRCWHDKDLRDAFEKIKAAGGTLTSKIYVELFDVLKAFAYDWTGSYRRTGGSSLFLSTHYMISLLIETFFDDLCLHEVCAPSSPSHPFMIEQLWHGWWDWAAIQWREVVQWVARD